MSARLDPSLRAAPPEAKDTAEAARSLEAYFMRQILAEVRSGMSVSGGDFAGDTFQEMFHEALADKMADAGGLGLAPVLESQLKEAAGIETPRSPQGSSPVVAPSSASRRYGKATGVENP